MFKKNKSHSAVTPVESVPGRLVRSQNLVNIDSFIHVNNCWTSTLFAGKGSSGTKGDRQITPWTDCWSITRTTQREGQLHIFTLRFSRNASLAVDFTWMRKLGQAWGQLKWNQSLALSLVLCVCMCTLSCGTSQPHSRCTYGMNA